MAKTHATICRSHMPKTWQNMGLSRPVSNMAKPACINDATKQQQRIQIVSKELWISLSWLWDPLILNQSSANTEAILVVWPTKLSNVLPCMLYKWHIGNSRPLNTEISEYHLQANQLCQLLQAQVWHGVEVRAAVLDIPHVQSARAESACLNWPTCPVLSNLPPPKVIPQWLHCDPTVLKCSNLLIHCTSLSFVSSSFQRKHTTAVGEYNWTILYLHEWTRPPMIPHAQNRIWNKWYICNFCANSRLHMHCFPFHADIQRLSNWNGIVFAWVWRLILQHISITSQFPPWFPHSLCKKIRGTKSFILKLATHESWFQLLSGQVANIIPRFKIMCLSAFSHAFQNRTYFRHVSNRRARSSCFKAARSSNKASPSTSTSCADTERDWAYRRNCKIQNTDIDATSFFRWNKNPEWQRKWQ